MRLYLLLLSRLLLSTQQLLLPTQTLDTLLERLPEPFSMDDLRSRLDEPTPYAMVALQECERVNALLTEMRRSLLELDLGLRGDLTMSEDMERLLQALAGDAVPGPWAALAYPSLKPLGLWCSDLLQRVAQLAEWTADFQVPKSLWLPGLFNPQAFLTAVMQTTARKYDWPLDKTVRGLRLPWLPSTLSAGVACGGDEKDAGANRGTQP